MKNLAPIALFVFNRPEHTQRTIEALLKSKLSSDSELYIFSDGPKDLEVDKEKVDLVRIFINNVTGFKKIHIIESNHNKGLANSIIDGVNFVFDNYDAIITLEDDVIVGESFLRYMNDNLIRYQHEDNVYMISGYLFNLPLQKFKNKNFFLKTGTTQAWGTWKNKWNKVDFEAKDYKRLKKNKKLRFRFNLYGGIDYSSMLIAQMETNTISSWAIRFRWFLFKNDGLILFPQHNLIKNIGWDGSGNHCKVDNPYKDSTIKMDEYCDKIPKKVGSKFLDYIRLLIFFYTIRIKAYIKNKLSK